MEKHSVEENARRLENALESFRRRKFSFKEDGDLKKSERFALWFLYSLNDGKLVTPSELAKKMDVTLAAVTHHLNALEEKGFVERVASKEDRRVVFVVLSGKGRGLAKKMKKERDILMRGMVEYLGESDTAELTRLINKISEFINNDKNKKGKNA